jgi:hypothetical protein
MRAFGVHLRRAVLAASLAGAVVGAFVGCTPGPVITPEEVKSHGTIVLRTTGEKAFKASLEALKQLGYEIAIEDLTKALIVTKRKNLPDLSAANGALYTKQYTIEVRDTGGATRVTATPAIFRNDVDVSEKKVWELDGPIGERELWRQLLAKIEQLL